MFPLAFYKHPSLCNLLCLNPILSRVAVWSFCFTSVRPEIEVDSPSLGYCYVWDRHRHPIQTPILPNKGVIPSTHVITSTCFTTLDNNLSACFTTLYNSRPAFLPHSIENGYTYFLYKKVRFLEVLCYIGGGCNISVSYIENRCNELKLYLGRDVSRQSKLEVVNSYIPS